MPPRSDSGWARWGGAHEIAVVAPAAVADRWWHRDPAPYRGRVARDAAERSGRVWLPRVGTVYRSVLRRFEWGARGFVLDDTAAVSLSDVDIADLGELVLVVGAASCGLDEQETAALAEAGAVRVRHDRPAKSIRDTAVALAVELAGRMNKASDPQVPGPPSIDRY